MGHWSCAEMLRHWNALGYWEVLGHLDVLGCSDCQPGGQGEQVGGEGRRPGGCTVPGLMALLPDCSRPSLARPPFLPSSASMNMPHSFGSAGGMVLGDSPPPTSPNSTKRPLPISSTMPATERCWPIRPTLRNELDTFSVHFYIFFGPNVSVPPDRPAVFVINLLPVLDSGGVLNLELRLNVVRWSGQEMSMLGSGAGVPLGHGP